MVLPLFQKKRTSLFSAKAWLLLTGALGTLVVLVVVLFASMNLSCPSEDDGVIRTLPDDHPQSALDVASRLLFPINSETGLIILPETVRNIIIDVGAMDSDYLTAMEKTDDNSTGIFLFDPLPENLLKLQSRAAAFATKKGSIPEHNRIFPVRAALSDREHIAEFNVAIGPSCGSLLESGPSKFWCVRTKRKIHVQVFTLASFMKLLPFDDKLTFHLKVDAEGADLLVLKGAGEFIERFDTVAIECQNVSPGDSRLHRVGATTYEEAREYMCKEHKFCHATFDQIGEKDMQGNAMFSRSAKGTFELAPVLQEAAFKHRYKELASGW